MPSKRAIVVYAQPALRKMVDCGTWVVLPVELVVFAAAGILAFLLRFDFNIPGRYLAHLGVALSVWVITKHLVFRFLNLHRGWRFLSLHELMNLAAGNLFGSIAAAAVILCISPAGFPRSIYLLDLLVCFVCTGGLRVFARMMAAALKYRTVAGERKLTLIYG